MDLVFRLHLFSHHCRLDRVETAFPNGTFSRSCLVHSFSQLPVSPGRRCYGARIRTLVCPSNDDHSLAMEDQPSPGSYLQRTILVLWLRQFLRCSTTSLD